MDLSLAAFSWAMGWDHMRLFMAGAKTTGQAAAQTMRETRSSVRPWAILAMMLVVAGATSMRSARSVREMCWGSEDSTRLKVLVRTGRPERASKVRGVM